MTTDKPSQLTDAEVRERIELVAKLLGKARAEKAGFPWGALFSTTIAVALIVPILWWRGWVAQILWAWFMLPLFPTFGLPSIYALVGAMAVLQVFLPKPLIFQGQKAMSALAGTLPSFLYPLSILCSGWLWHMAGWGL